MTRTLIALGLGVVAALVSQQVVVGLLVAAAAFWLGQQLTRPTFRGEGRVYTTPRTQPDSTSGIEVVCKQVTPLRQEWVSLRTGRLFDVLSQNGPPGAQPGDHGWVVVQGSGYRIRPSARSE